MRIGLYAGHSIAAILVCVFLLIPASAGEATLEPLIWSGYEWDISDYDCYNASNVRVDDNGDLHLKISNNNGSWSCAEIVSKKNFSFGKYQFWVIGRLDKLDKSVVLGLYNYPPEDVGHDGTNEIDIEISRWNNSANPYGEYDVKPNTNHTNINDSSKSRYCPCPIGCIMHQYPPHPEISQWYCVFNSTLTGNDTTCYTTHRFIWQKDNVYFQSLYGHRDWNDNDNQFSNATTPKYYSEYIPQKPMPILINFWLCCDATKPSNDQPIEIIIRKFTYDEIDNGEAIKGFPLQIVHS